jgi:glucokinase
LFDSWEGTEAKVETFFELSVNGRLKKDFFEEPDQVDREFAKWGEVKELFFQAIKGKRLPGMLRVILAAEKERTEKLLAECGIAIADVAGAGIASPGTVNPDTGVVEYANNIKFSDFPLVALFSKEMGIPESKIKIGNDANLAALGEAVAGAAKGSRSSVMITLGTGVGGGVILDGVVLTGCAYGGAELGHMVIEKDGRQCSCGRKGCLEAYCSATALVKLTKEKFEVSPDSLMREMCENDINRVGGKTAFAAMKKGDKAGAEVVETYLSYLACGVANLINIFQPEVFTIGGGVSGEGDNLIVPLKAKVAKETYSKDNTLKSDLRIAKLGNDAGIIGAAAFATR